MFKELEIMKTTLRYLLMVVAMVSVLSVWAQNLAQQPVAEMTSTSVMVSSGSSLPQAAATGAYVTGSTVGTYSPASAPGSGPRKISGGNTGGGPEDREDPYADPLGDATLPLALCALAYALMRVFLKRKRA